MRYVELQPPPPLNGIVRSFWFLTGDPEGVHPQPVVPDGRVELVLHMAEPFGLIERQRTPQRQARALVAGQLTRPILLTPLGRADVIGIRFRTVGAGVVLGVPISELTNQVLPLGSVAPRLADALFDAAARRASPEARTDALAEALTPFVTREPSALVRAAVAALAGARTDVGRVAQLVDASARTLQRRFRNEVGLAPKAAQRVLRFRRAFRLLQRTGVHRWAVAAVRAGYYDQGHLIRDFRRFAGAPPSEFFRANHELASAFLASEPAEPE